VRGVPPGARASIRPRRRGTLAPRHCCQTPARSHWKACQIPLLSCWSMRTHLDQFAKVTLRPRLEPRGRFGTEEEVSPEPQRIDIWFVPGASGDRGRGDLLDRMTDRPCMIEPFSRTPTQADILRVEARQGMWDQVLGLRKGRAHRARVWAWILSPGRPTSAIDGLHLQPLEGWPRGLYGLRGDWNLGLVVIRELPPGRDTLILRLLGAGRVREQAIEELLALPPGEREIEIERALARFHKELLATMAHRPLTKEEEDVLDVTRDVFEQWEQQKVEEGIQKGLEEGLERGLRQGLERGLRQGLEAVYRGRFGGFPRDVSRGLAATRDVDQLRRLYDVFMVGSIEEIRAALATKRK
jgi:hypothetical protein